MRRIILSAILLSGCMTGQIQDGWRTKVLQSARFDAGCGQLVIVAELPEATGTRYRLQGCGRSLVYVCRDRHGGSRRDAMDIMIMGGRGPSKLSAVPYTRRSCRYQASHPPT